MLKPDPIENPTWAHTNGILYRVLLLTNEQSSNHEKYPPTVVYIGGNGNTWSRPLKDWHRSFKPYTGNDHK